MANRLDSKIFICVCVFFLVSSRRFCNTEWSHALFAPYAPVLHMKVTAKVAWNELQVSLTYNIQVDGRIAFSHVSRKQRNELIKYDCWRHHIFLLINHMHQLELVHMQI